MDGAGIHQGLYIRKIFNHIGAALKNGISREKFTKQRALQAKQYYGALEYNICLTLL
jgi:hypothetical protein